jgi:hypothetical protein
MHKWNKKMDSTFKLVAHASIKLYQKKQELLILNVKSQSINNVFELLPSCINKSTQFVFFRSNLQTLAKPKQKRKNNFRIVAPMHQHNNRTIKPTRKSNTFKLLPPHQSNHKDV